MLAAPWFVPSALQAQKPIRFDPSRDLEGFDACFESEFRDLYPVEQYSALLAKEMKPEELADVQKRWKADLAEAETKLAKLRADPVEESLWLVRDRLGKSDYFSKITWTEDRSVPGFAILVQDPAKPSPDYAANIVAKHGPWLRKLDQVFTEQYVKPLALERRHGRAAWVLAILASEGDYRNFDHVHHGISVYGAYADYAPKLGIAVGYEDPFDRHPSIIDEHYSILSAVAREMMESYEKSAKGKASSLWIDQGLPCFLAYHEGAAPDSVAEPSIRAATLWAVLQLAKDAKKGPLLLHPIEELVGFVTWEELEKTAARIAKAASAQPPAAIDVGSTFCYETDLWMHFLHRGMEGKLRKPLQDYLLQIYSGESGPKAFRDAFAGTDPAAIDRAFLGWLAEEGARATPPLKVESSAIADLFERRAAMLARSKDAELPAVAAPDAPAARSPAPTAKSLPAPPFSPAVLAVSDLDVVGRHGLALAKARAGDLATAAAGLEALSKSSLDADEAGRVSRDLARIRELERLREAFLESLRATGVKWSTEIQGKKIVAAVARVEDGVVYFAENRQKLDKAPLSTIDPLEIARQAVKKEQQGSAAPWARTFAYVLAEDARSEAMLKDPSEEVRALREDARTWLPGHLRAGRAASAMEDLSKSALPKGEKEGDALCARIRDVVKNFADVRCVQSKMAELRILAQSAVEASLSESDPAHLLHGKYAALGNGRAKLAYEFENAAEAQDLERDVGYMKGWHEVQKKKVASEDQSAWTIEKGRFVGKGSACYRLPIRFSPPMVVRYELRVLEVKGVSQHGILWAVGLCDDRKENSILAVSFGDLHVRDDAHDVDETAKSQDGYSYEYDKPYEIEAAYDGARASIRLDGETKNEIECSTLAGGDVLLWFHAPIPIAIERIEVEGAVDPASFGSVRAASVRRKLAELGFP